MKPVAILGCLALLSLRLCYAADTGVVTIVDGEARLLRGATWYRLVEGARVQDGDVIEPAERAQVQVELSRGGLLNVVGPAALFLVSTSAREAKQPAEVYLSQGWVKLSTKPAGMPLRLRTPLGVIEGSDTIAVVHAAAGTLEVFIESGAARLSEQGRTEGSRAVRGGDFVERGGERPLAVTSGAPQAFVSALPRHFMDSLPRRAERFRTARVEPAVDGPISYAEAEPWLAGPYRRVFIKRFQARLADPAFRDAVTAGGQAYPEWSASLAPPAPEKNPTPAKAKEAEKPKFRLPWPFGSTGK